MKIWLDTDIGSDIDDALALAFLLCRPDCELVGISTVTEYGAQRARLASALCRLAGKEVPIFPGAGDPLLVEPLQTQVPQANALARWAHDEVFPEQSAPLALADAIRREGKALTLLSVGPLTNVALAWALDPALPSQLGEWVAMAGSFQMLGWNGGCEWNVQLDPHAAQIAYASAAKTGLPNRSFGLDVTSRVVQERAVFQKSLEQTELGRCIWDMAQSWLSHTPRATFHDPLAAAALFEPSLCSYARGQVEIELDSPRLRGFAHWKKSADGPHQIAETVEVERFFDFYFQTLNQV